MCIFGVCIVGSLFLGSVFLWSVFSGFVFLGSVFSGSVFWGFFFCGGGCARCGLDVGGDLCRGHVLVVSVLAGIHLRRRVDGTQLQRLAFSWWRSEIFFFQKNPLKIGGISTLSRG